jgi:hypothetical protein
VDPYAESIRSGEAYWVFSRGASDYTAPLEIDLDGAEGLDFGSSIVERRMRIRDLADGGAGVLIRTAASSPMPLSLWTLETVMDPGTGLTYPRVAWPNLEPEHAVAIPDGDTAVLRLAVRRAQMSGERAEGVLEIFDGVGTRLRVPVEATRSITAAETGLWVGSVTLAEVNEVNDVADPLTPTPTPAAFSFRIIVHVDDGGTARLLTQVFQMWEWDDPPANTTGHYVLISDDDRVPLYDPASLRDGDPVSYRISAVVYDFDNDDPLHPNALAMEGGSSFGYPATLSFVANLGAASSTNPFVHWYHPDHDTDRQANDIDYDPADPSGVRGGAYDVVRTWTLTFADTDPQGEVDPPQWGDSLVGGTFEETIAGLHKGDVVVRGEFRLWRVTTIGTLNP